jgi:hypothetical protein
MRIVSVLTILSVFALSSSAQVTTSGLSNAKGLNQGVQGLGFAISAATGLGVSYRYHLPSKTSLQGVFGIIKTSDKLALSLGGEYQYDLVRGVDTRFFFIGGIGYYYNGSGKNDIIGPSRIGVGIGGEFKIHEAFHISVGALYTFYSDSQVLPLPQISAHYYFF